MAFCCWALLLYGTCSWRQGQYRKQKRASRRGKNLAGKCKQKEFRKQRDRATGRGMEMEIQ